MKKNILVALAALLFVPYASFAQERLYDESSLILHSVNYERFEDTLVDCAWASPFLPMDVRGGWRSELYSLQTRESSGKVTGDGQKIGEMWSCFDAGQDIIDPTGPQYEQYIAFAIFIEDEVLGALGTVKYRAGGEDFPAMYGITASVVRVVDDLPQETIGSMTSNEFIDSDDIYGGSNGIVTLRLFTPRDYKAEIVQEILDKLFVQ
ncbi:MAG: hypothetical protein V7700_03120 [Halioglobus sp.]